MYKKIINSVLDAWSATAFAGEDIALYAQKLTLQEARRGLMFLSAVMLCLFATETVLFSRAGLGKSYVYTCSLLALLAVHIFISAHVTRSAQSIYLLGTTLLLISGTAFVLLAHQTGAFSFALFASVTLLFMVIPIVPWGLREGIVAMALIYVTFTASTWAGGKHFDSQTLWSLQFVMIGAGLISLALVARNAVVRKADIRIRFDLEQAHHRMMHLSHQDPLTGAWNRRYLKLAFSNKVNEWQAAGKTCHFALLDIDNFKPMNDTCGHDFGDEVLRCVSRSFTAIVGDQGLLVRMGGDEFSYLFAADNPEDVIAAGMDALRACMERQCKRAGPEVSISVGLVSMPPDAEVRQEYVYREADIALYEAKDRKQEFTGKTNLVNRVLISAAATISEVTS
jgi:diguanylate cyclase (GGDEF)-like protein